VRDNARRKASPREVIDMAQAPATERNLDTTSSGADRTLRIAAAVFLAGFAIHNADHLRRGVDAITTQVMAGGVVVSLMAVAALALIAMRHQAAPFVAMIVGFATVIAVSGSHLLPHWSSFSDAFPGGHVDGPSWFAVLFEVAGALLLGIAGLVTLRRSAAAS
jgi:hypothetical protein